MKINKTKNDVKPWKKLDNAALIFPSSSTKANTYVFRFSCELFEDIDPDILQSSVDKTIKDFPLYNTVLKRGLFWYYLEETTLCPKVYEENIPFCAPLFLKEQKTLLYRVFYYKKRINIEIYHVLSDGAGAIQFLKSIVRNYLCEKHAGKFVSPEIIGSESEHQSDSFNKYYSGRKKNDKTKLKKNKRIFAYQIKSAKYPENRISLAEAIIPTSVAIEKAREYGVTLTVLLSAALIYAIYKTMPVKAQKKPVMLTIPVNLRKFFPSETTRNFFSIILAGHKFNDLEKNSVKTEFEEVLASVEECLKNELVYEKLYKRLNSLSSIERNIFIRISPLALKDIVLYFATKISHRESTGHLSNVGRITMPEVFSPYIRSFNVANSTEKVEVCVCSYNEKLSLSFTSIFRGNEAEKYFFRLLSELGIPIELSFNHTGGERGTIV